MKGHSQKRKPEGPLQEADLIQAPALDFAIRKLDEYSAAELEVLLTAVTTTRYNPDANESAQALDVWCYRIRDAWKEARQREAADANARTLAAWRAVGNPNPHL